jgi:hypothetical protein
MSAARMWAAGNDAGGQKGTCQMTKEFKLTIETGNDAFADGNAPAEIARILREAAPEIEELAADVDWVRAIYDINGNRVGEYTLGSPRS